MSWWFQPLEASAILLGTPSSGAVVKVWDGAAWNTKPVKVWDGASFVTKTTKVWSGSAWI